MGVDNRGQYVGLGPNVILTSVWSVINGGEGVLDGEFDIGGSYSTM